jgi:hypothetical protein
MRKKEQRRISLRLMENQVLDFMVLCGLEFCFGGKRKTNRENIQWGSSFRYMTLPYTSV